MCKVSLRETRKKELKEEIFLRALTMFKERGYENVTVEEITAACGIAKGTFYNYFPKKEHVLLHLGREKKRLFDEAIARYSGVKDVRERLRLIFGNVMAQSDLDPDLMKATILEILRSWLLVEQEWRLMAEFEQTLTPLFAEAIEAGQVSPHWSPQQLASVLVGIYLHALFAWSAKPEEGDKVMLFCTNLDILWDGIRNGGETSGA
ncbi:MAG: TetR/AcrR family transcriptional regulator [Bacillota bacterium]